MEKKSLVMTLGFVLGILACSPLEPSRDGTYTNDRTRDPKGDDAEGENQPTPSPNDKGKDQSVCPDGSRLLDDDDEDDDGDDDDEDRDSDDAEDNDDEDRDSGSVGNSRGRNGDGTDQTPSGRCQPTDDEVEQDQDAPSFAADISPIMLKSCATASCHSSGARADGINLETKEGTQAKFKGALGAMKSGKMPIGGAPDPTPEQIAIFELWGKTGFQD